MNIKDIFYTILANFSITKETVVKISISLLIIIALWVFKKIIVKIGWKNIENVHNRYRFQKTSSYITFIIALLIIGRVWFEIFQSLATILGLLSAGIAIALKDIITDIAGFLYIIIKRPFEMGDRVQIGKFSGDVIDIRIFKFSLIEIGNWVDADQSTGRILHMPNEAIFNEVLANYSKGFMYIWDELPVLLTFESNWKKAKNIFTDLINEYSKELSGEAEKKMREASKKFLIYYSKLTPIVYTTVKESGILLTFRYLCEPKKRRAANQYLWENILDIIEKNPDISLAYPTVRVYYDDNDKTKNSDNTQNQIY